ncbi:NUDIX hydrolase [Gordonia hydrophobica]|uniref:NUDIX domain-containing protein n=1 Tax=Gordonia hydrophobica TaxID=40516 RepID=A0ABZ2U169_9ACTN|nr:NUDIX domain-containing protein [Gordonia hydrophobica]MBM7369456.1 acetyl-CoA carboxylase carboxyl transferase subunit beta [Gordonia hydrophobica]
MNPVLAAGAVVVDDAGRILMVKRGHDPEKGRWSVPGGHVEVGETLREAAAREVFEETGFEVAVGDELWCVTVPYDGSDTFEIHDFSATVIGGSLRAGDDADDARWVAPGDLTNLPLVATLRDHFARAGIGEMRPCAPDPSG